MKQMNGDTFVIIPAKPLDESKTRLAAVLPGAERVELSRRLLQRTIHLARQVGEVVLVSRDAAVRKLAKQAGAWALVEAGQDLNSALQQASDWVVARKGQAVLIVPGDLPLLQLSDLTETVVAGQGTPAIVIAPSQRLDGTNALFLRPPGLIEFAFGPGSFAKHQQAARAAGVEPVIYRTSTIALDLDLPEDLIALQNRSCYDVCIS
ncbi:MAG: 2-phospho-L-lactate guanylyltransferase [Chloroflexi bacterium]|nr:2-phospho-L-lactate guanylyltransferase [Chloroflexota bacterium]